jgi:hypothetical protein
MATLKFVGLFWLFVLSLGLVWLGLSTIYRHMRGDFIFANNQTELWFFGTHIFVASCGAAGLHFVFT